MTIAHDEHDMLPASGIGRFISLVLIILMIFLMLFFWRTLLPIIQQLEVRTLNQDEFNQLKLGLGIGAAIGIGCALYASRYGRRILSSGQCPPPQTLVGRDTRITRGNAARRIGRAHLIGGLIAGLFCIVVSVYLWTALQRISPAALPNGVSIVPGSK